MHFTKLRLVGFKSFVEPTELVIEPGLTGVVGPNGCGKSNLVEAIRWVMGENSAKRMRGGAMDDVIFAGTATRPARNQAEVGLFLDNAERRAPAAFNDESELDISRRIERESGSTYRINGREVRARDVQLLFADLSTGAHSTAIVSQGRIGSIINAKPTDRRGLLEEAAGITGLHSRRHEAELRLRAAENNLERLDDVTAQLEAQLQSLKRQARQATRYRNISGHIRRAEATLFHLQYTAADEALTGARAGLADVDSQVTDLTAAAASATTAQTEASTALPPLRTAEAEAAAAAHRLSVAREGLDQEEAQAREALARVVARIEQIAADRAREEALLAEAREAVERLTAEATDLEAAGEGEQNEQESAAAAVEAAQKLVTERQQSLDDATEQAAGEAARRTSVGQQITQLSDRIPKLETRARDAAAEKARLVAESADDRTLDDAAAAVEQAREEAADAAETAESSERARLEAQGAEAIAREKMREMHEAAARLEAEEFALAKLLDSQDDELWPPLIDAVTVEPGYEAALGAALGDDLNVPADTAAPAHWAELPPYDRPAALPDGAEPLDRFVRAPAALARRLSQVGVIDSADAPRLAAGLAQGQRLVSRDGGLWRWDGLAVKPGAPTAAATRLEQRNRLFDVRDELDRARKRLDGAKENFETAKQTVEAASAAERAARQAAREADAALSDARDRHGDVARHAAERTSRLKALQETEAQATADLAEAREALQQAEETLTGLPPEDDAKAKIAALRADVDGLRGNLVDARAQLEQLRRAVAARRERLAQIGRERDSWSARIESAERQVLALTERDKEAAAERESLERKPEEIAARRVQLLDQIDAAEANRTRAADELAKAEAVLAECDARAKTTQSALQEAREERVRRQGQVEQAETIIGELTRRIREELDCEPHAVLEVGGVEADADLPELSAVEMKLERLKRERDNMGPVNLRADIEAQEIQEKLETLGTEREDLEAAIARLRQGISSLNREGRQRLLAAFKQVDEHFQELFQRVFGGGRAHLALTESEDPLEAGLEIMASPPGKRLQVMSLLSGGEQALTAISLLFAVFLTCPAPICILDEVDAPLDDSNVERLCGLLEEMSRNAQTRFLVVTHNPITMARMDRLFGVTMGERGVSQLVSVDLGQAEELRESA